MIVGLGFLIGALIGALIARKKGGNRLDILQHAAVIGVMVAILALFVNILILRFICAAILMVRKTLMPCW